MIHSLTASLNVYSVPVKQEQKHLCIPRQTEALLGLTVFSCPHQKKRTNQFKIAKQQGNKKKFPSLFHTRVFNYEFIQTKISEISLLPQSLARGAFKPTTAEEKGRSRAPAFQTISSESMFQPVYLHGPVRFLCVKQESFVSTLFWGVLLAFFKIPVYLKK